MIAVVTDNAVGGTFLTWTLHFLSGQQQYYHAESNGFLPVPGDPTTERNAHGFQQNQPLFLKDFNPILNCLTSIESKEPQHIYFHWLMPHNKENEDTQTAIQDFLPYFSKIIVLSLPLEMSLYHCQYSIRTDVSRSFQDTNQLIVNDNHRWEDFINYFFRDSKEKWNNLDLTDHWDQREFLALNLRPFKHKTVADLFVKTQNHYQINAVDLWTTFDSTVQSLFKYLEIDIDPHRYQAWHNVYIKWKQNHLKQMMFCWYFKIIINNIINGHDMDLSRFNLDIVQEAAIQHYLIYKHNLNFKTWQLEKFINTKQLHNLLEPNIHPLLENNTIKI
jgi:hypothetical protein